MLCTALGFGPSLNFVAQTSDLSSAHGTEDCLRTLRMELRIVCAHATGEEGSAL